MSKYNIRDKTRMFLNWNLLFFLINLCLETKNLWELGSRVPNFLESWSALLFNVCLSVNSSVRPFFSPSVRQCACLFDSLHTGLATDRQKNSDRKETRKNCYTDRRLQICCWFRWITNAHFMLLKGLISIYDLRGFPWNLADNNVSLSIHWYRGFVWAL